MDARYFENCIMDVILGVIELITAGEFVAAKELLESMGFDGSVLPICESWEFFEIDEMKMSTIARLVDFSRCKTEYNYSIVLSKLEEIISIKV